ncbi:MAG: hypothetical protein ABI474_05935 [Actinomycetota bacterium]
MSTLIPPVSPDNPVQSSPDDDQTGVRALLSALPEPGPMPAYLVERIGASLAAERAQRAHSPGGSSVTPMLAGRRRPGRLLFAIAGAAAAVVLIGVLGNNLLTASQTTASSGIAASDTASGTREAGGAAPGPFRATPPSANDKALSGSVATPASIQIRASNVRYADATFVAQARALRDVLFDSPQPMTAASTLGPTSSVDGLVDCMSALGAAGAQMVQADIAFYEGQPAVIIVATRDGIPTAYVAGRECSRAHADALRPSTTLP